MRREIARSAITCSQLSRISKSRRALRYAAITSKGGAIVERTCRLPKPCSPRALGPQAQPDRQATHRPDCRRVHHRRSAPPCASSRLPGPNDRHEPVLSQKRCNLRALAPPPNKMSIPLGDCVPKSLPRWAGPALIAMYLAPHAALVDVMDVQCRRRLQEGLHVPAITLARAPARQLFPDMVAFGLRVRAC